MGSSPSKSNLPPSTSQKKVISPKEITQRVPAEPPPISGTAFDVFLECLAKLPFTVSEEKFETIIYDIEEKTYEPNSLILQASESSLGIFVIVEGRCNILASDERTVLRSLKKGEFFGEISSLYNTSCTCSVFSDSTVESVVLLLPIDKVQLLNSEILPMKEWYVKQKYIDINNIFPAMEISKLVIKKSMFGCPFFHGWSDDAFQCIYKNLLPYPIGIHSPSTILFFPDDQMACAYLLIHGEVEVFSENKSIVIDAKDRALWFGDEQLFSNNTRLFSARAQSPCQIVTFAAELFEPITEDYDFETKKLSEIRKFWKKHLTMRDNGLYENNFELMNVLSLLNHLKRSNIFSFSDQSFMYFISLGVILRQFNDDDTIMVHDTTEGYEPLILMVLAGGCVVRKLDANSDENLYPGDTFYFDSKYEEKCHVKTIEKSLVGIISKSLIEDIKMMYPEALVNVDW